MSIDMATKFTKSIRSKILSAACPWSLKLHSTKVSMMIKPGIFALHAVNPSLTKTQKNTSMISKRRKPR
jgi:hypothetical protein